MLTSKEAEYLLSLKKVLKNPKQIIDLCKKKNRFELISNEDVNQEFLVEVTSNDKIFLKTSIHHLETTNYIGLLRIDFKGTHQNPEEINEYVPDFIKPYANKFFTPDEHHIHIYIEGYRPLAWAIPLVDYNFDIKNLYDKNDIVDLINKFAEKINLESRLNIIPSLF